MRPRSRSFADAFQDKLNGLDHARNPTRMRLTDRNPGQPGKPRNDDANPSANGNSGDGNGLADNSRNGAAGTSQPGAAPISPPRT